ncbi:hypothetical protein ACF1BU_21585 [Streptomyces sp. NPDC014724]|uniref:hypothetical protein n=1 Tax=unclassified Streptomyces TaxID=2593676 RepID=UPI0036F620C6
MRRNAPGRPSQEILSVSAVGRGATAEQLHDAWRDFKTAGGGKCEPMKDEIAHTHPCLISCAALALISTGRTAFRAVLPPLSDQEA